MWSVWTPNPLLKVYTCAVQITKPKPKTLDGTRSSVLTCFKACADAFFVFVVACFGPPVRRPRTLSPFLSRCEEIRTDSVN